MLSRRAGGREGPESRKGTILLPHVRGRGERQARHLSEMRNGARSLRRQQTATRPGDLHLPDAPEIEQDHPGNCPICGMALEPKNVLASATEENAELREHDAPLLDRRCAGAAGFLLAMAHMFPAAPHWVDGRSLALDSVRTQHARSFSGRVAVFRARLALARAPLHLNMFTLIAIGVGAAYFYSAVAMLAAGRFSRHRSAPTGRSAFTSKRRR